MENKKSSVPKLRFPGFTGAWEQRRLGEVAEINPSSEIPDNFEYVDLESVVGTEMIAYRRENKKTAPSRAQRLAKKGDIFYQTVRPYQKNNYHFNLTRKDFVFSTGYAQLRPNINGDFLFVYIQLSNFVNEVLNRSTGTSYPAISPSNLIRMKVAIPTNNEQEKIGAFFKQLDSLIALHQRKLEHLQEQKKGLLQKMFPKNGETVPEVRFPGFTDAWEQRKLSSMTQYKNGKGHEDKQKDSGDFELVNLNSISIDGGFKHSGKFINESDDGILYKNDLVMILSDVGHGNLLGRVALIPDDNKFILNQRVALLRPNKTVNPEFLFFYINSHQKYFKSQGAGMAQLNISKKSVETFSSLVPNIDEQKKISLFLMRLDSLIALHQRKLDHLELMKKGLLQQMFV